MNLDMEQFRQTFLEEASDLLAEFEASLLRLEQAPDDPELVNTIFRCAHSLKGGAATFGLQEMAHFTHSLETLLDGVRGGFIPLDENLLPILFESLDHLKELLESATGGATPSQDSSSLIARIEIACEAAASSQEDNAPLWRVRFRYGPGDARPGMDGLASLEQALRAGAVVALACDLSRLPDLAEIDPAAGYLAWDVEMLSASDAGAFGEILGAASEGGEICVEAVDAFEDALRATSGDPAPGASEAEAPQDSPPGVPLVSESPAAGQDVSGNGPLPRERREAPDCRQAPDGRQSGAATEAQTLRVSTGKVDKLVNLVGELVISQSILNEVTQDFTMAALPRLLSAVADMDRATRELQERVMAVRMLPIKHAFGRFPRLVHDLSTACGKLIELRTTGEETELDKTLIESIGDPLVHLVRNAIDHGLEMPDERFAAGKPAAGTLSLNAFQEGGSIVIEVSDDGRGLDRDRILSKAIERGLLSESDAPPPDEAIYNFIFHPGFSTAEKVTDLSGRGVGMDIVRKSVQHLGGSISLTSVPGQGTCFRVRLPLTMAILEGLTVSVGDEAYVLPLTSIVESIRPKQGDVRLIGGRAEAVVVRAETLPLLRLHEQFGVSGHITEPHEGLLVIVENDGRKVALFVDRVVGQSQAVIKSLETNYQKVEGVAGATILGDGRVALILDVPRLVRGGDVTDQPAVCGRR